MASLHTALNRHFRDPSHGPLVIHIAGDNVCLLDRLGDVIPDKHLTRELENRTLVGC